MDKIDFKKSMKALYNPPAGRFVIIDVPPLDYFAVDGAGDPNTAPAYREAVEALYAAAYTLKFTSKKELARDYVVPPLEGLWWAKDMASFKDRRTGEWSWTLLIMIPDFLDCAAAEGAIAAARKKSASAGLDRLRVARIAEGRAVQILHIGPYDAEGPTLARLHQEFLPANGLVEAGHHHEIYLSDPRRTAADKLKTILRQPVRVRGEGA